MNIPNPPFDPPYVITHRSDNGVKRIAVMADGTTKEVFTPAVDIRHADRTLTPAFATTVMAGSGTAALIKPSQGTGRPGRTYLQVPFAEKDEAKSLGARWDAAARKWYVAEGADLNAFARWAAASDA